MHTAIEAVKAAQKGLRYTSVVVTEGALMTRFDGSTALTLDFGHGSTRFNTVSEVTTTGAVAGRGPGGLRLAPRLGRFGTRSGQEKYKILDHRRRQAQIKARHLLELMEEAR